MYDVQKIRSDFPILSRQVNGKPLTYLDNGASAQKPQVVIDAVTRAYSEEYSNVHRGLHYLSNLSTEKYEAVRGIIARFLGASNEDEIVLNSGTTEGINLVAYGWAMPRLEAGDEIVLSVMEHHANIVPWHFLRERLRCSTEMDRCRCERRSRSAGGDRCDRPENQTCGRDAMFQCSGYCRGCQSHHRRGTRQGRPGAG